jgi:hypothetical protein
MAGGAGALAGPLASPSTARKTRGVLNRPGLMHAGVPVRMQRPPHEKSPRAARRQGFDHSNRQMRVSERAVAQ